VAAAALVRRVFKIAAPMHGDVVADELDVAALKRHFNGAFVGHFLEYRDRLFLGVGIGRHAGEALGFEEGFADLGATKVAVHEGENITLIVGYFARPFFAIASFAIGVHQGGGHFRPFRQDSIINCHGTGDAAVAAAFRLTDTY
jgi:hypothetical protein